MDLRPNQTELVSCKIRRRKSLRGADGDSVTKHTCVPGVLCSERRTIHPDASFAPSWREEVMMSCAKNWLL